MTWHLSALGLVSFAAAVIAASVAAIAWRRRTAPGAAALALLMLAVTEWTSLRGLEATAAKLPDKVFWAKLEYLGIGSIGPLWLAFALGYARQITLSRRIAAILCAIPAISVALVMTNEYHGLVWTSIERNPLYPAVLIYGHGPCFWILAAYTYILLAAGAVVTVQVVARFPAAFRVQAVALLLAVALPWCGNIVYLSGFSPVPGLDLTPLALTLSGVIAAWVVLQRDLLDLIPVARERLIEQLGDGVIVLDPRRRIVDANPAAARALGFAAQAAIGAPAATVLAAWPDLLAAIDGPVSSGEITTAEPRFLDFRVSALFDVRQRVTGHLVSLRDVTERRRGEKEIRRLNEELERRVEERTAELIVSQQRFETLARVAPVGIYRTDASGRITYANDTWRQITGLAPAETMGTAHRDLVHPDDLDRFAAEWPPSGGTSEPHRIEMRLRRPGGDVVWVMNHLMADIGTDGRVRGSIGAMVDITDLKRAEEDHARLAALVENSPDLVAILDPALRLVYVNASGRRLLGLGDAEDVRAYGVLDFMAPDGRELIDDVVVPAIRERGSWDGETPLRPVGKPESIVVAGRCFVIHGAPAGERSRVAVVARDITARKRAEAALRESEEQLRQAQKMEAVGRLAGGIAHDFNNLLAVIIGQGELLEDVEAAEDDRRRGRIEVIRQAARRALGLTRQLLAFSRKQILKREPLDLNEVVRSMGTLLQRVIGEDVEVSTSLAPGLGRVRADRSQLEQVILNLAVNARDAMPQGGRITIETRPAKLDPAPAGGPFVALTLADTGAGIPPDVLPHVFEPFFTTKAPGEGTGLGLSTAYGIVEQHGGHIAVDSVVGRGTTVRIYLPLVAEPAAAPERERATPRGDETILLVEDEDEVRSVVKRLLEALGYTVIEAGGADAAMAVMEARGDEIHLLLTDVVMPRKSGRELADGLRRRWPRLPVVYMSGYTANALSQHGLDDPDVTLLPKPFTRNELGCAVRAALDRGGSSSLPS